MILEKLFFILILNYIYISVSPQHQFMVTSDFSSSFYFVGGKPSSMVKQFANELKSFYVTDKVLYQFCYAAILNWIPVINMKNFTSFPITGFEDYSTKCFMNYYIYSEKAEHPVLYTTLYKYLVIGLMENSFDLRYKIRLLIVANEPPPNNILIEKIEI